MGTVTGNISHFPSHLRVNKKIPAGTSGKFLLKYMLTNPDSRTPTQLAEELQLTALSSTPASASQSASPSSSRSELHLLCETAIQALPSEVAAIRAGNKNVLNKIVGYVMKQSRGRADAKVVRNLVEEIVLSEEH
jgi:aspartyl-tRNA(Asn)/glutamyl-tRNA(Gln) amidotransferase subunit B